MTKTLGSFKLTVQEGTVAFRDPEIIATLWRERDRKDDVCASPRWRGAQQTQQTSKARQCHSSRRQFCPKSPGTVRLLLKQVKAAFLNAQFRSDVVKAMNTENILDQEVKTLSG